MENRGRLILLINRMVTDCIGLHSVLSPLLIVYFCIIIIIIIYFTLFDIQQVFVTILNADKYKFNSDICKEASKLSEFH